MNRWVEYFEETLNRTDEHETEKVQYITSEIEIESPSLHEVKMAIDKQKNNRAPGEDFIVAELFKNGGQSLLEALHKIIVSIWEKEVMPKEWNTGLICPIFKKGGKLECKNYRGITLLSIAYKVLSYIILERTNQHSESVLKESSAASGGEEAQ
jgi:hypothetical protein